MITCVFLQFAIKFIDAWQSQNDFQVTDSFMFLRNGIASQTL